VGSSPAELQGSGDGTHEGGGPDGHQKGLIPTEIKSLKWELANVSATWRRYTHTNSVHDTMRDVMSRE
jgi:hypothetical protein